MADEKKVLTPEEISDKIEKLWDSWLDDEINSDIAKNESIKLIREYGEQQRLNGYGDGWKNGLQVGNEDGYSRGYDACKNDYCIEL